MKILCFTPYATNAGHYEVDLEHILTQQALGHEVHVVECGAALSCCDANVDHDRSFCSLCVAHSTKGLDLVQIPQKQRHRLDARLQPLSAKDLPSFENIQALAKWTWKGQPAGLAIASSLVSGITRDTDPPISKFRLFIEKSLCSFASSYAAISSIVDKVRPDELYVFNGRSAVYNPIYCVARSKNLPIMIGERDRYEEYLIYPNTYVLARDFYVDQLRQRAQKMDEDPHGVRRAEEWFQRNRRGNSVSIWNYLSEQSAGKLPQPWFSDKKKIAIFLSSEDEHALNQEPQCAFFPEQVTALKYITEQIQDPDIHFYARIHPNLMNLDNAQNRALKTVKSSNLTMIDSKSDVDTYELMDKSDKVLTFGSTVGVEATYWGKPSILVGRCFYEAIDACYRAESREHLIQLLRADLAPKPKANALKFAYFQATKGIPFQYVSPQIPPTHTATRVAGKVLSVSPLRHKISGLWYWFDRFQKWRFRHGFSLAIDKRGI